MKRVLTILLILAMTLSMAGCGSSGGTGSAAAPTAESTAAAAPAAPTAAPAEPSAEPAAEPAAQENDGHPEIPGLTYLRTMEKEYAIQFDVYYYEGGYKYLAIGDGNNYLVVPEGAEPPAGLDSSVKVLQQPLDNIYLAATAVMALFDAMDALDTIALTSLNASDWYVAGAKAAMERGEIVFGGKYSEPDYELIVDNDISLALENTMILHTPKVIEMIELLGVPVFIEYSSYEAHPLGRTEWIKLFGALINREAEAEEAFRRCTAMMAEIQTYASTGKTVAIFLVDSTGKAQVRSTDDYLSRIVEIGGGVNAFSYVTVADSGRSNVNMTMEEFYANAMDVDYLIYNSSGYSAGVNTLQALLEKSDLLADCKAYKEGNIFWIGPEVYQQSDKLGDLIYDVHLMLTDGDESQMTFLHHME